MWHPSGWSGNMIALETTDPDPRGSQGLGHGRAGPGLFGATAEPQSRPVPDTCRCSINTK